VILTLRVPDPSWFFEGSEGFVFPPRFHLLADTCENPQKQQAEQTAEKVVYFVIPSEARNLSFF
jgi:hypothetical protein